MYSRYCFHCGYKRDESNNKSSCKNLGNDDSSTNLSYSSDDSTSSSSSSSYESSSSDSEMSLSSPSSDCENSGAKRAGTSKVMSARKPVQKCVRVSNNFYTNDQAFAYLWTTSSEGVGNGCNEVRNGLIITWEARTKDRILLTLHSYETKTGRGCGGIGRKQNGRR